MLTLTEYEWYGITAALAGINAWFVGMAALFYWRCLEPEHRATAMALSIFSGVLVVFGCLTALMSLTGISRPAWFGLVMQVSLFVGFGWLYYKLYFNGPSRHGHHR